jgi:hypothetical protein
VEHSSRSPKDDPPAWPAASFQEREGWAAVASGFPSLGLRHGLLIAMEEMGHWYQLDDGTEAGRLLGGIYLLSDMVEEGNTELSWLIAEARHKGVTWASIAEALGGLTRQAAHRRFAPLIKERLKDVELGTAR